jgi:hypothetical protein
MTKTHNKPHPNKVSGRRLPKPSNAMGTNSDESQQTNPINSQPHAHSRSRPINNQPRSMTENLHQKPASLRRQIHPPRTASVDISPPFLYSSTPFNYIDRDFVLEQMIRQQIEYYFSIGNLCRDIYFRRQMDQEGFVDIAVLANFPRIRALTSDAELIRKSLLSSDVLELRNFRVRRRENWQSFLLPFEPQPFEIPLVITPLHTMVPTVPFNHSFASASDADLTTYYVMANGQVNHSCSSSGSELDPMALYNGNGRDGNISMQPLENSGEFCFSPEAPHSLSRDNKPRCVR